MSIGRGWAPEQPEEEIKLLASNLLKDLLADVFEKIKQNKLKGREICLRGSKNY